MLPLVFLSFNMPNAMDGSTQAKYRKNVVDKVFWTDLGPTTPTIKIQQYLLNTMNLGYIPQHKLLLSMIDNYQLYHGFL